MPAENEVIVFWLNPFGAPIEARPAKPHVRNRVIVEDRATLLNA